MSGALYGIADTARLAQSDRASEGCEFDPRGGLLVLRLAGWLFNTKWYKNKKYVLLTM